MYDKASFPSPSTNQQAWKECNHYLNKHCHKKRAKDIAYMIRNYL